MKFQANAIHISAVLTSEFSPRCNKAGIAHNIFIFLIAKILALYPFISALLWVEPEFKAAIEMDADIVVILLGANDTKAWNWDEHKDEFIPDYTAMIDTFRSVGQRAD